MLCPKCSADIPQSLWRQHHRRFHSGARLWPCADCAYRSDCLEDALSHGFVEGHRALGRKEPAPLLQTAPKSPPVVRDDASGPENDSIIKGWSVSEIRSGNESGTARENEPETETESNPKRSTFPPEDAGAGASKPTIESASSSVSSSNSVELKNVCRNCGAACSQPFGVSRAVNHVKACLRIRPYACSVCRMLSSRKADLAHHISSRCVGAEPELVDQARDEAAIRNGLRLCYPDQNLNWKGLA